MALDDSQRVSLARFALSELEAVGSLLGLPTSGSAEGPDGPIDELRRQLSGLREVEVLSDVDRLLAALREVATWSWYRFAVRHAVNVKFLEDLLDAAGGAADNRNLSELLDTMRRVTARLEGGWLDVRFDESDPDIKREMQAEIAAGLHDIVNAIAELGDELA